MNFTEKTRHIPALDGLRGIALLSVLLVHSNLYFSGPFAPGRVSGTLAALLGCGWVGVDLFFVLSGFLITGILLNAKGSPHFLRNFYARRALRIWPLYFGYLLFVVAVARLRPGTLNLPPVSAGDAVSLALYYYNFRVALVTQSPVPFLHQFWSLSVEEHFYLLWPLLVGRLPARALMRLCLVGIIVAFVLRVAVVASGAWLQVAYLITPCRMDGLLAGAFLALALRSAEHHALVRRWAAPVVLGSGCLLLGLGLGQRHFFDFIDFRHVHNGPAVNSAMTLTVGIAALSLFFAGLLFLVVDASPSSLLKRWLETPWLVAVGRYSYAMYVFHSLLLSVLFQSATRFAALSFVFSLPDYVAKLLLAFFGFGFSFLAAFLSYHLFEKWFLSLKRYFEYRPLAGKPRLAHNEATP